MSGPQPHPERRRFVRQNLSIPLLVEPEPPETAKPSLFKGQIRDINNRGAYFRALGPFRIGQTLHLSLRVSATQSQKYSLEIRCEAVVVRTEPAPEDRNGMGVAVRILRFDAPKVTRSYAEWMN